MVGVLPDRAERAGRLVEGLGLGGVVQVQINEEIGVNYELVRLDKDGGEHKRPEYLKLNPTGRIPTLVDPACREGP